MLEDGILEVDGPPAEEVGVMCTKYAELRSAADWWKQDLDDGSRTFRDIDGFRLLRLGRVRERDLDPHYGAWATVEVRRCALPLYSQVFGPVLPLVGTQRLTV